LVEMIGADGIVRREGRLMTMGELLTFQAERDGARPALTCDGTTISRLEIDRAANRLARALAAKGVQQGS
jgi:non-ribosomal peptide synthetase component E (peptide arylation enzyme)